MQVAALGDLPYFHGILPVMQGKDRNYSEEAMNETEQRLIRRSLAFTLERERDGKESLSALELFPSESADFSGRPLQQPNEVAIEWIPAPVRLLLGRS